MIIKKNTGSIVFDFLLLLLFFPISQTGFSQTPELGISIFDSTNYVEYIPGNLPIVISVPHGGYLEPDEIPDRNCNVFSCTRDAFTQELARSIGEEFLEQTGCYPHIIINLLHRKKFDANRDVGEAADGDATVEQAWRSYHTFIDDAKAQIIRDYERGLFLDIHGHGHAAQRIELGYRLTKSELQLNDSDLDAAQFVDKSSIRTLVGDNLMSLTHAELLRGSYSFGTLLGKKQVLAVPSKQDPFPIGNEGYFSGGYNTGRHGSAEGGNIDAIQIECDQTIRFDTSIRNSFADSLTKVVNEFINVHYNEDYINNYCTLATNVIESNNVEALKIFPNPTTDYFSIESNLKAIEVEIFSSLGKKVFSKIWNGSPIFVGSLESGYYIVQFRKGKESFLSTKLIKH